MSDYWENWYCRDCASVVPEEDIILGEVTSWCPECGGDWLEPIETTLLDAARVAVDNDRYLAARIPEKASLFLKRAGLHQAVVNREGDK